MGRLATVRDDGMRREVERFRELMRFSKWIGPRDPIDPDVLEGIRRGAEPFRRALSLARYIGHHSLKERDIR